jgi:hypothetical protein
MFEKPNAAFHKKRTEEILREVRSGHVVRGERRVSPDEFPLLLGVMAKEGEERHRAAAAELSRLVELVSPMLEKSGLSFEDFLAGQKPFGEADYEFSKARRALKVTIDTFRDQGILTEEEINQILSPEEEITEEISRPGEEEAA